MNVASDSTDSLGRASSASKLVHSAVLRWWPAALLMVIIGGLKLLPKLVEAPSLPIIMISFMGPTAVGLLIFVWWLAISRASWREKLIGTVGFIAIAAIAIGIVHFSLRGMGLMIMVVPTGIACFTIPLILLASQPKFRVPVALLCTFLGFGVWSLLQSEGVTGDFTSQLKWRWEPTAEQLYLADLSVRANEQAAAPELASITKISLESAAWPSFRGPNRDATIKGISLAEDWKTQPPKKLWSRKIGPGWSSFAVAENRLFTQEQRGDDEAVLCLDADSGDSVWDYVYPSRFWEAVAGAGPRATPTLASEGLFAYGAEGILVSLDPSTGQEVWRQDLKLAAEREPPQWGFSSSPLVVDGVVIVHAGGTNDKGIFAFDAATGKQSWSVASGDHSYSSPQLAQFSGVNGVLMMTNFGLQFISPQNGETIWEHQWAVENYRAIQPLVFGNSVLIATSLGLGTRRLQVEKEGDYPWKISEVWTTLDMKPDFNDYVLYQNHLYGFDGNIFGCINIETGKRTWKKGRYGSGQVLLLADSNQLLVSSEKGEIILLRVNSEKLEEVTRYEAIDGKTWNHPVLVGNRLYLRNAEEAACFELPLN